MSTKLNIRGGLRIARLAAVVQELRGILEVTTDHGNADEMFQRDKKGRIGQ